jgi:hypothetical protein
MMNKAENNGDNNKELRFKHFEGMFETAKAYEELCWSTHRAAKQTLPGNGFVGSLGVTLFKSKRLTPNQLVSLMDMIDGV